MDGFLLINKPVGMTSHDVVSKVKKQLRLDKVGHTGTLDPFASGLLILCVGKATKLAYLFNDLDKAYEGTIVFHKHYDTYDVTGNVIESDDVTLKESDIHKNAALLVGNYDQRPPMFSAIKINGQKLYDLARKGIEIEVPKRNVEIYRFNLGKFVDEEITFSCSVSKGTYIRSLAVDLAEKLGTFAALKTLNRTEIGNYHLSDAHDLDKVKSSDIIDLATYFKDYPKLELSDYLIHLVKNGVYLDERQIKTDKSFIVIDKDKNMIAFYEVIEQNKYKPALIF